MKFFRDVWRAVGDVLFPPLCLLCGAHLGPFERNLWRCSACALPEDFPAGFFCPACTRRSPSFPSCHPRAQFGGVAPWSYEHHAVKTLIRALKYGRLKVVAASLGTPYSQYVEKSLALGGVALSNAVIIPIPLHRAKLRKRGFNQSLLLARTLRLPIKVPILEHTLLKTKPTPSQTAQEKYELRAVNVAGSFAVRDPESVRGKTILLLDDVITSGATMSEAARVLRLAGAKRVIGIAVARA